MWSKKRRREKETKGDSAGSGKEDQSVLSPPPQLRVEPKVPRVLQNLSTNQPVTPVVPVVPVEAALKPLLSVPLPSAPLTSSILDSLQSTLVDPAMGGALLLGNNQMLSGEGGQQNNMLPLCEHPVKMQSPTAMSLANRTQVFDYGNQSNKALECAAIKQLENDYQQDRW